MSKSMCVGAGVRCAGECRLQEKLFDHRFRKSASGLHDRKLTVRLLPPVHMVGEGRRGVRGWTDSTDAEVDRGKKEEEG